MDQWTNEPMYQWAVMMTKSLSSSFSFQIKILRWDQVQFFSFFARLCYQIFFRYGSRSLNILDQAQETNFKKTILFLKHNVLVLTRNSWWRAAKVSALRITSQPCSRYRQHTLT